MVVTINCPFCGKEHSVVVDYEVFCDWQNGKLIQVNLIPTERKQLISDLCPECQEEIFG